MRPAEAGRGRRCRRRLRARAARLPLLQLAGFGRATFSFTCPFARKVERAWALLEPDEQQREPIEATEGERPGNIVRPGAFLPSGRPGRDPPPRRGVSGSGHERGVAGPIAIRSPSRRPGPAWSVASGSHRGMRWKPERRSARWRLRHGLQWIPRPPRGTWLS